VVKIRWEAPPKRAVQSGKYEAIAKALKANPGEWAIVSDNAPASYAVSIKKGLLIGFVPAGSFEATTRKNSNRNKRVTVYARYIG
jgi:hypothetical protein